ncbi:MAG: hypothetical protein ACKOSQ_03310 [Planctomycetaceae bacterium]
MATGLFDSTTRAETVPADSPAGGEDYRAISGVAVAAAALAAFAPLAFVDWWLAAVPVLAIVLGVVALGDITRRPHELAGRPLAIAAMCVAATCLGGGLARLAAVYAAELPPGFERLSYALLQPAEGDPPDAVPVTATALDGRDVLLKGYMYPGSRQEGIVQFLLVRDQGDCCFGGNPKVTDRVNVLLADPRGIDFTPRLVKIAGRFRVRPAGAPEAGGGVLYHLEAAQAR